MQVHDTSNLLKNLLIILASFLSCMLIAGVAMTALSGLLPSGTRESYLIVSVVQNLIGFCGTALISGYVISRKPLKFSGLTEKVGIMPFIGVIIVFLIALPSMNQLIYYNSNISFPDSMNEFEKWMKSLEESSAAISEILLRTQSIVGLVSGILIIGLITGFSEELLFRGTLQKVLTDVNSIGKWGIWIAAFIFSVVHLQFYGFVPRLLLGAFFGYLLFSTGSIWPGVFAHALNNSIVVVSAWLSQKYSGFNLDEDFGVIHSGIPYPAIFSLIALIFFFKYFYHYFFNGKQG